YRFLELCQKIQSINTRITAFADSFPNAPVGTIIGSQVPAHIARDKIKANFNDIKSKYGNQCQILPAIPIIDFSNIGHSFGYTFDKPLMCTGCCMLRSSINVRQDF
ncbi:MAG: hypothetical protein WCK35_28020, partial [Chloroflexota bacterium]